MHVVFKWKLAFNHGVKSSGTNIYDTHPFSLSLRGLGRTGTYLTNEAKGADDAPDADTAIINADGNHAHAEEKKEYFI